MDTLDMIPSNTAQGKARAALVLGVPTAQLADAVSGGKPISVMVKRNMPAGEMTFMRGGLPIMRDGKMIGSIGVGGSATENDEKFAQVAIDAMTAK
jgi:glc operon protein GlcG